MRNSQFSLKSVTGEMQVAVEMATNGSLKIRHRHNIHVQSDGCVEKEEIIGGSKVERRRGDDVSVTGFYF